MGAFLQVLFGPLLQFVEFLSGLVPRFVIVRANQLGVKYPGGGTPVELQPGFRWYWPIRDHVTTHYTAHQVLDVNPITVETEEGTAFAAGMVVVYRIVDVLAFEVGFYDADDSLAELGEGALRKLILKSKLGALRDHRQPIDDRLAAACRTVLEPVGVEVVSARLTEQAQVSRVFKVFGMELPPGVAFQPAD